MPSRNASLTLVRAGAGRHQRRGLVAVAAERQRALLAAEAVGHAPVAVAVRQHEQEEPAAVRVALLRAGRLDGAQEALV